MIQILTELIKIWASIKIHFLNKKVIFWYITTKDSDGKGLSWRRFLKMDNVGIGRVWKLFVNEEFKVIPRSINVILSVNDLFLTYVCPVLNQKLAFMIWSSQKQNMKILWGVPKRKFRNYFLPALHCIYALHNITKVSNCTTYCWFHIILFSSLQQVE